MRLLAVVASLLLFATTPSFAQWLDNSNKFNDSLHNPVCTITGDQVHTFIVKDVDGGYFILWQDGRNRATNLTDIYAQKFDKDGKRLWTVDGVPVATGTNDESFAFPQNIDNRAYSYAAPDGTGGLYVCWQYTQRIGSYDFNAVAVQHLHSDGTRVFGNEGITVGVPDGPSSTGYSYPQMVPDSHGGFFIAYMRINSKRDLVAYCYKDEGGTLKLYGGGQMDEYGLEQTSGSSCGTQYSVSQLFDASVQNFMLYPDQQGGCNIVMAVATNVQQLYLAYNRLARVKKDCHTTSLRRAGGDDPASTTIIQADYKKDSVVRIYNYKTYSYTVTCHPANDPNNVVSVLNTRIENNGLGYLPLNLSPKYLIDQPHGVILQTGGNINAELMSTMERELDGQGGVTSYHIHGYYRLNEIYDSIPYELCSDMSNPYVAYRQTLPDNAIPTDTLSGGPDSLIYHSIGSSLNSYSLAGSGNKVWVATKGAELSGGPYSIYLQELKLVPDGNKRYKFTINTNDRAGVKIGQEVSTGSTATEIYYNTPAIATDSNGHGLFYILEAKRYVRASPIAEGAVLSWGAMGRPTGNGTWNGFGENMEYPFGVLSYTGKGLLAWDNNRNTGDVNSAQNVWMERVSDAFTPAYQPPLKTLQLLGTSINQGIANYLTGSTGAWTTLEQEVYTGGTGAGYFGTTPVVSIMDNYALGSVFVNIYENSGAVRVTSGLPYLSRNWTIVVGNNPHGSGNIPMRLYIPQAEFDALKAADPRIATPGDLGIIKQPNDNTSTSALPSVYTPVTGEENVPITGWGVVDGGYYIELVATGFSNFFVAKGVVSLPLTWIDVTGRLTEPASAGVGASAGISWTVADEKNVKGYTVQYAADGINFVDGCATGSGNSGATTSYSCTVALPAAGTWSFRVREEDVDGKYSYSKIVVLQVSASAGFSVSPNPVSDAAVLRVPGGSVVKKLSLLSVSGQAVWQSTGAGSGGTVTIPMAQLPAGVYHLQVVSDREVQVLKVIKR